MDSQDNGDYLEVEFVVIVLLWEDTRRSNQSDTGNVIKVVIYLNQRRLPRQ